MAMTSTSLGWISIKGARSGPLKAVATLGPTGTSSERAAGLLWRHMSNDDAACPRIHLYDEYEFAAASVRSGSASHFVVANAYQGVNEFYMDDVLSLAAVFVMDTPPYGLAAVGDVAGLARPLSVVSHPSPVPLIVPLLPEACRIDSIIRVSSTSAAARAVRERTADLALTTSTAALAHGLTFVSRTRRIRMVWSVFTPGPRPLRELADEMHLLEA